MNMKKKNLYIITGLLILGSIFYTRSSFGTEDTIRHFIEVDTLSCQNYPSVRLKGFVRSDLIQLGKTNQLKKHLRIHRDNIQYPLDAFQRLPSKRKLSIHLFLDLNHLSRRKARQLFNAVLLGELKKEPPCPRRYVYIPKKEQIGTTKYLPGKKRFVKVKYPPGALLVKKMEEKNKRDQQPALQPRAVQRYISDSILHPDENANNHLFIFAFEKFHPNQFQLINYLESINRGHHLWSTIYYEEKPDTSLKHLPRQILSFLGEISPSRDNSSFESLLPKFIEAVASNHFMIEFTDTCLADTLRRQLSYQVVFAKGKTHLQQELSFTLPENLATRTYTNQVIKRQQILRKKKKYPQALAYLWKKHQEYPNKVFLNASRKLFLAWAKPLKQSCCRDIDSLFNRAEQRWNFSVDSLWYEALKFNLLSNCLDCLEESNAPMEERLAVLNKLREIRMDKAIERKYWLTKSRLNFTRGCYWKSAYALKNVTTLDESLQNKLRKVLGKAFYHSFKKGDHQILYENGSDFLDDIRTSRSMRYMYGYSCAELKDYRQAAHHYEWLLSNWEKNPSVEIELETLYSRLKDLYKYSMNFDAAIELDRLIYKKNQNEADLYSYLGNLRARYLQPLINLLPEFIKQVKPGQMNHLFSEYPVTFQLFIKGVYLKKEDQQALQILFSQNNTHQPDKLSLDDIRNFPAYREYTKSNDFFLINRVTRESYVILHLDKSASDKELAILDNIRKQPRKLSRWRDLGDHQEAVCLKTLSQCIAGMLETKLRFGYPFNLQPYWAALESNDLMVYMVMHGKNGKIMEKKGFTKGQANYRKNQYKKSATTMAFYQQTIHYGDKRVFDLSNPIFNENGWQASIRMGFRKD